MNYNKRQDRNERLEYLVGSGALTIAEAARAFRISENTIRRIVKSRPAAKHFNEEVVR